MKSMKHSLKLPMGIVFLLMSIITIAQVNLNDKIPLDPNLKIGKLANGLTYFIRENKKPENKVELRLVVNAGSVLENDDQQGLAHMAEHMAFNGTKNFKKNDIISFLQTIGVGFGNDLNAYTSFNETVYILPIPTDKEGNLEKGFQILEDWAHNVTYLEDDINGERNVILEESRTGKGAQERIFRQLFPHQLAGSAYASRLPIGKDSIIKNFKTDAIRRFYKEWYRPNLMGVIVVGDVDPATAEALIKKHFAGLVNPTSEKKRVVPQVNAYNESAAKIVTDKEATNYQISVAYSAFPYKEATTVGEYKNDIVRNIFTTLVNNRLRELTQKENPPFIYGYTYFGSMARGYNQFNAGAGLASADATQTGLSALMEEIERAKRFGFTQGELDRAKLNLLSSMEKAYNERDKTESYSYVDEYIRNFLENEPIPGIATEFDYYKALIPQITLDDVKGVASLLKDTPNFFVSMSGPESADLPTAAALVNTAREIAAKTDIKPYEEKIIATKLLSKDPEAGKVIKETTDDKLGTKTWKLSNGTTVTIKKTDFKNDEIQLGARRYGGTSNYGFSDKYNANYALSVVNAMGFGDFSPTDLQKALAGKSIGAGASLSSVSDAFYGNSTVKDLETMFQLLYLKATSPRVDTALFRSFVQKNKAQLTFLMANPQAVFIDTLMKTVYQNNPLTPIAVPRPEYFDQINMARAIEIYKENFGNAYGMHFAIVGSIDEATLKPLVEKYIGGLPSNKETFNFKDNGLRPVKGNIDVNVYKGEEQKSLILGLMSKEVPYSEDLSLKAAAVSKILNIKIIEELREKIQGIYGGGTSVAIEKIPYENASFNVQLPCGPDKVDTLLKAMDAEITAIQNAGPSEENLNKVKMEWIEKNRISKKENGFWLGYILSSALDPTKDVDRFLNYEKYVNALTPKEIQEAAKTIFTNCNSVTAILYPEKK